MEGILGQGAQVVPVRSGLRVVKGFRRAGKGESSFLGKGRFVQMAHCNIVPAAGKQL